ncbi:MAG: 50S ribosomal protein L32e [Candidatus Nanopusillus acidilobi]
MMNKLLKLRKIIKRKKPDYLRFQWWKVIKLRNRKESWRRPRGIHNKIRRKLKSRVSMVEVGYGSPREVKGLLLNGKRPVLVHNLEELEKIDKEKECAIIASNVGKRKREQIINRAKELNIEIFNI